MDPELLKKYQRLETSLRRLLAALPSPVSEEDRREATEKIDHAEFAIALQVIGAVILDYDLRLESSSKRLMRELLEEMGMNREDDDDYWFWEKMQPVIGEG